MSSIPVYSLDLSFVESELAWVLTTTFKAVAGSYCLT